MSRYNMGLDILTAETDCVTWSRDVLSRYFGYFGQLYAVRLSQSGNPPPQAVMARRLALRYQDRTIIIRFIRDLAPAYPKTELVLYPLRGRPGRAYHRVQEEASLSKYSDPNWQSRTFARIWVAPQIPTPVQWRDVLLNQTNPPVDLRIIR